MGVIRRYLIVAGMVAAVALWGWHQKGRADDARAELAEASRTIAGYEAAAAVHRAHIQRLEQITADAVALDREFQSGEGADAPLDNYLRNGAGRLWQ